ncbi:flagellar basal body rod protein FlgB [Halalkalibacillus sediminis]|uniref:Flagellar basal body rod protein FlgB n=1 Tax=Halalkalibacillus sediminis TaxID=2018042 RepID=A0A2I0QWC6_9BACI|nr:flagellar basal body rod protein FlgB [Halalkalibacillus sediminis]PKR78614.1 flagellar basal body rod protein FlgB [Halalkalibacillus sediminis]
MDLFGKSTQNLQRALDYSSLKNQTIAHNIANVDTPGYKAKDVKFDQFLNEASSRLEANRTHAKHLPFDQMEQSFSVKARQNVTYNHNGNSVDLDKEMSELAKNQLYYEAVTERINGKFNTIKTVLGGGS